MEKYVNVSRLPQNAENVLELEEPERYSCRVWRYAVGHSVLAIVLNRDDAKTYAPIYAIFDAVEYFEGKMWWKGANLKTTGYDEYFKLWMNIHKIPEGLIEPFYAQSVKLFTFDADGIPVRILAGHISLTDEISGYFPG